MLGAEYLSIAQRSQEGKRTVSYNPLATFVKVYAMYNASGNVILDEPWDYNRLPLNTLVSA